jgi:hypothetical protein
MSFLRKGGRVAGLALLPAALALRALTFRFPDLTERVYGEAIYPRVAELLGALNGAIPFSLAEAVLAVLGAHAIGYLVWRWSSYKRRRSPRRRDPRRKTLLRSLARTWTGVGALVLAFLVLWGFNYARPSLAQRLELPGDAASAEEILKAGRVSARMATQLHGVLGMASDQPTHLPLSFHELNEVVEGSLRGLDLPGYGLLRVGSPAKALASSGLLSYLGLSGVFVPFTGEPSINDWVPDASLPVALAHEKAHQRGVTDEAEASLVAFMVCADPQGPPYLRYAAYLFAASRLLGAASRSLPEEAAEAWTDLGEGPRRDLLAIHEFWSRYEGPAAAVAERVNDTYLRSNRVAEGVRSYGRVVQLLVALDRRAGLVTPEERPSGDGAGRD